MSAITYGSGAEQVTLPYANITRFAQTARYDDSNTDWYCTDFDIQATAVINFNSLNLSAPDLIVNSAPATSNPAAIMSVIRSRLLKPRQTLSVKFNGVELIPQATTAGTVDVQNGPRPQSCEYLDMSAETFMLMYHIQASYWEKNTVNASGSPIVTNRAGDDVLYNRWQETVDINNADYSTRTRDGKFIIRSDNKDGFIADQLRSQMAAVSVPPGFLRESSRYTVDPSGLAIQYTVVDREVFKTPPSPAFRASGDFTERCGKFGATRTMECRCSLEGSKNSDNSALIRTAVFVCYGKIKERVRNQIGVGVIADDTAIVVDDAYVRQNLYENSVEAYIRAYAPANIERVSAIAAFAGITNHTPGSSVQEMPAYLLRGTAGLLLQAAAYYDPSLAASPLLTGQVTSTDNPLVSKGGTQMAGRQPGQAGKNPE